MKHSIFKIHILCALLFSFATELKSKDAYELGDSIMHVVMEYSNIYKNYLKEYQGSAYIKGTTTILRTNNLHKWMDWVFPECFEEEGSIFEMNGSISYHRPNQFVFKPDFTRSTTSKAYELYALVQPLLNLNIYADTSFDDKFIMPGSKDSKGVYQYRLADIIKSPEGTFFKIKYTPIRKNLKVINGYIYIKKNTPYIYKIEASGYLDISFFELETTFRSQGESFMLPTESKISITYDILKNISTTQYHCLYSYNKIEITETKSDEKESWIQESIYDLTDFALHDKKYFYEIKNDEYWDAVRDYKLSSYEKKLYRQQREEDSLAIARLKTDTLKKINYLKLSEAIISNSTRARENSEIKYSGIINPALVGYSKTNGIVIRQRLHMLHTFHNDMAIEAIPEVGFAFGSKELYLGLRTNYWYKPERLGKVSFEFQKGNKGFSSAFIENIESQMDSTGLNFDSLGIKYYRDYHFRLENSYEVINGLLLNIGTIYTLHKPVKNSNLQDDWIENDYADFMPFARVEWTPKQYYKYIGKQKVYLNSPCPTFTLEYSQGIKGILSSNSQFKRVEFNMHQRIELNRLRAFSYRFGIGGFFDQESEYFIDYRYFRRRTYPDTWSDRIGGVYNLLDSHWYYAAPHYVQLHLMYDSPYILLHFFKRISRYVLSERIYLSQLYTPTKPCYTELGYGIGNYIINFGVFAAFDKGKYTEAGVKVSFILGKYW